jgi:hypothetical protein
MSTPAFGQLVALARASAARGALDEASTQYLDALWHVNTRKAEYDPVALELLRLYAKRGLASEAVSLGWYLETDLPDSLLDKATPFERARTLLARADALGAGHAERPRAYRVAAKAFDECGALAHAGIAHERGEDPARARAAWVRLCAALSGANADPYAAGLARFNLARAAAALGDASAAREAVVAAVHHLEEAADRYESSGQRERAFDCYQVLIAIGESTATFEHVLEGYVNVIRILREDHLRYYAVQSFEDAIAKAAAAGEVAAAATLSRELATYARAENLPTVSAFATLGEARLWGEVAQRSMERKGPAELAENALLAAVLAYTEAGQFGRVGDTFRALAGLPLPRGKVAKYQRASSRYDGVNNAVVEATPLASHLRSEGGFPEVWHVDLVEWEHRGAASRVCGDVVLDTQRPEPLRRRAMVARIVALAAEEAEAEAGPKRSEAAPLVGKLVERLAHIELYEVLSPLEHVYARGSLPEQRAVLRALERFYFKRSFALLRGAALSAEETLRADAARTLRELVFPHAFDPLLRIYREAEAAEVRKACAHALARIDRREAAEAVIELLAEAAEAERADLVAVLRDARTRSLVDAARTALPTLPSDAAQAVEQLFTKWGVRQG